MKRIENRSDVEIMVNEFYTKIRVDELLGPIFNSHIAKDKWPHHLSRLTDFWETNLFGVPKFKGNPGLVHAKVDRGENHKITQVHFGKWLELWFMTIDELYEGEKAEKAKASARKMSTGLFLVMFNHRN